MRSALLTFAPSQTVLLVLKGLGDELTSFNGPRLGDLATRPNLTKEPRHNEVPRTSVVPRSLDPLPPLYVFRCVVAPLPFRDGLQRARDAIGRVPALSRPVHGLLHVIPLRMETDQSVGPASVPPLRLAPAAPTAGMLRLLEKPLGFMERPANDALLVEVSATMCGRFVAILINLLG